MVVKFDTLISAALNGIEINGKDLKDCKDKLYNMSLSELLEEAAASRIYENAEQSMAIVEEKFKIKVTSIDFDITEDDIPFDVSDVSSEIKDLKSELNSKYTPDEFEILCNEKDLDDEIIEKLIYKTGYLVNNVSYDIDYLDR